MIKNIKGAIFDMDGTLIDSLMLWEILWSKFGIKPSSEHDKAVRTMTLFDAMEYIHALYGVGESGEELYNRANEIMVNFYTNEVELKAGVLEFLEHCKNAGIKMCVASASAIHLIKLAAEHCKIKDYFCDILSCADIGKGKDEPDIYIKALEALGTEASETCIFEDSHIALDTASKLGMKTVGIYDKYNYGQDEIKKIATVYIGEGESLEKLIGDE